MHKQQRQPEDTATKSRIATHRVF